MLFRSAEIARKKTRGGMFACDLKALVAPDDSITITVLSGPKSLDAPADSCLAEANPALEDTLKVVPALAPSITLPQNFNSWTGDSKQVLLADAQNVVIKIEFRYAIATEPIGMQVQHTSGVPPMDYNYPMRPIAYKPVSTITFKSK